MADKSRCEICDRTFKDVEGLAQHNSHKHPERVEKKREPMNLKKYRGWFIFVVVLVGLVLGVMWLSSLKTVLPPTDMVGHIEVSPPSHVMREPMDILVHKHMLEHADGVEGGKGGAIINYNCVQFECEPGLIENLESFADKYDHVYVAPFKNMGAKIALTKLNKQEILEEYDEERIDGFVR